MRIAFNAMLSLSIIVGIYYMATGRFDAGMSAMAIAGLTVFVMEKK